MKRSLALFIAFLLVGNLSLKADEGMWLPNLLEKLNEKEMQDMGMRISAEDIYSINNSSLKDAIVRFGGGCTGEIVSDQGLLITNHHCGFGSIQKHSTVDHDYLTDGFWAMSKKEELANPGLIATFLVRMNDVTTQALEGVEAGMTQKERQDKINENIKTIKEEATKDTHYHAIVKPFYYGNQYYLFVTETFKDVRLVGAPPSNIGKFGGDTDNWMWPRHTGDFSIFRIYADKDNQPAEYSEDNVPYKPKHHIPISLKGIKEGDFTFVFGFPGRTKEYLPSYAVENIAVERNPIKINLRDKRLSIFKRYQEQDPAVRIQYASKAARVANYWKKMIGESKGIKRLHGVDKKKAFETEFVEWVNSKPEAKKEYGQLIPEFETYYTKMLPYEQAFDYFIEAGLGIEIVKNAGSWKSLINAAKKKADKKKLEKIANSLKGRVDSYFKDYYQPIDEEVFVSLLTEYKKGIDPRFKPEFFNLIDKKFKGNVKEYANYVFEKSIFNDKDEMIKILDNPKASKIKKLAKDPAYMMYKQMINIYIGDIQPSLVSYSNTLDSLQRVYVKAMMEMQPEKRFYPDANSTLRIAYGKVGGFKPKNGTEYRYYTTLEGIMEKENPDIYDYVVEDQLKKLYNKKDYGRYADKEDGKIHVAFIADNHTTGGNSGSPVLDADGNLIGVNFDRCWESTMSDLMFDPNFCRNITLDIRYCLFVIDKFAGAKHIVDEMTIIE
ncbi:MAG: S46 family peptidase [Hyphomicrobiales bacterium]